MKLASSRELSFAETIPKQELNNYAAAKLMFLSNSSEQFCEAAALYLNRVCNDVHLWSIKLLIFMKEIVKVGEAKLARVRIERPKINPETEKRIEAVIERSKEDLRWIFANEDELISKYNKRLIAVQDKKVVFVGQSFRELFTAIKADGKELDDFTIKYIKEKPIASLSWKSEQ